MDGYRYIIEKQSEWAKNKGIELIGSKVTRGRLSYTSRINENIFQALLPDTQKAFSVVMVTNWAPQGFQEKCKLYIRRQRWELMFFNIGFPFLKSL